uniref:Reverse transcriptase domain-containing protein n=1 Tax=Xenopus tropicalis TaxID=8364 RepID=A0A803J671_XENTR
MQLHIVSVNVKGLNSPQKRKMVLNWARESKIDILCLQETHFKAHTQVMLKSSLYSDAFYANAPVKKNGVAILIRNTIPISVKETYQDPHGRFLLLNFELYSHKYSILNVYAPNDHQVKFVNKALKTLPDSFLEHRQIIVLGDFNIAPDPFLDKLPIPKGQALRTPLNLAKGLQQSIKKHGLYDAWRAAHPAEKDFTFFSHVHLSYSRIDLIFLDPFLLQTMDKVYIGIATWTDHAPIGIRLKLPATPLPNTLWKLNNSILSNPKNIEYLTKLTEEFKSFHPLSDYNPDLLWCTYKAFMRGHIISLTSEQKRKKQKTLFDLHTQLSKELSLLKKKPTEATSQKVTMLKGKINDINAEKVAYQLLLLKQKYYSDDNKCGRLLTNKLREARAKSRIESIKTTDGKKLTNPTQIAQEFAKYYSTLYNLSNDPHTPQPTQTEIDSFLDSLSLPILTQQQREHLNQPISADEVTQAIKILKNNKAPGPDGFTNNFYKKLVPNLSPLLTSLFNNLGANPSPRAELFQAIITTIPKPGKDPNLVTNYRPISLLNSDIKIYAKILATRLNPLLQSLIVNDQVGFVPNRQAPDNTRKIINIARYANSNRVPCLILSLDAEKAFNRVAWPFIKAVLLKFGFSDFFLDSTLALYTKPSAKILTNGFSSTPFFLTNGTRQGCPLSPLIFALIMEPLAETIRKSSKVQGYTIGSQTCKTSLFADNVIITITDPSKSLPALFQIIKQFSLVSFYKINTTKTEALPIWIPNHILSLLKSSYKFEWQQSSIKYLGIHVSFSEKNLFKENFVPMLSKFQKLTQDWMYKDISWLGRIAAIKCNLLPKILYLFRTIPINIPAKFFTSLQGLVSKFIWQKRRPRIAYNTMTNAKNKGGLALPNFKKYYQACHLILLQRFFDTDNPPQWVFQEASVIPTTELPITSIIWIPPQLRKGQKTYLPATVATLKIWDSIIHSDNLKNGLYSHFPITGFQKIIDNLNLIAWTQANITMFADLFQKLIFQPFTYLRNKFRVPNSTFFAYLQLSSYLRTNSLQKLKILSTEQNRLYTLLQQSSKISQYYARLLDLPTQETTPHMKKWEADINTTIDSIDWNNAFSTLFSSISSIRLLESSIKLMYRWYMTPAKIYRIFPATSSNKCWRNCNQTGSFIHIWWECPKISQFWFSIFPILTDLSQINIPISPRLALLNLDLDCIPWNKKRFIIHVLAVSRLLIARNWKSTLIPTLNDLTLLLNSNSTMEYYNARNNHLMHKYHAKWDPWNKSTYSEDNPVGKGI